MMYVLAFERNKNDYVPIDLSLLETNLVQMTALEELDRYTMHLTEEDFRKKAEQTNIYSEDELSSPIVITYYDNGKIRKLEDGPLFEDRAFSFSISYILEYILSHLDDREVLNHLYNYGMRRKKKSEAFSSFLEALHQRKADALKQIMHADYIEIRLIALYIADSAIKEKKEIAMTLKNKDAA